MRSLRLSLALFLGIAAPVSAAEYHYLRSNSSSWGVSDQTRMVPIAPQIFELSFNVSQPWMVSTGDDVVLTTTPQLNAWGDWQRDQLVGGGGTWLAPLAGALYPPYAGATHFSAKYPATGRYRATYNQAEGYLAIVKASPVSGDVAWKGAGGLALDKSGRMFRTSYRQSGALIARIDPVNGLPRWVRTVEPGFYFDPSCSGPDGLLAANGLKLELFDHETGATRWSVSLNGTTTGSYVQLQCREGEDRVVAIYGQQTQTLAALRRSNGQVLWSKPLPAFPSVQVWLDGTIVVSSGESQGSHYRAYRLDTGAERWRFDSDQYVALVPFGADLYMSGPSELRKIDPATGAQRWRKAITAQYPSLSTETGTLFLRADKNLEKIDPANGNTLWSISGYEWSPTLFATSGGWVAYDSDAQGMKTRVRKVRTDGSQAWSREVSGWASLLEDSQARLYLRTSHTIALLDLGNGASKWTYQHPVLASGPYNNGISQIGAADAGHVYVVTYGPGSRYPPMQIQKLDAATGAKRWEYSSPGPFGVVSSDSTRLFLSGGFAGDNGTAVLK
jgi:hypothetical protein